MSDAIGSGLVEVDAAGQRLSHAAYEPFGDVATSWGSSGVGSRKYYAGHDRQLDVDLVYMNARWMNPGSGTFISVDPLVRAATVAQSFNGYAYVENNPVTAIDPSGMLMHGFSFKNKDGKITVSPYDGPQTGDGNPATHGNGPSGGGGGGDKGSSSAGTGGGGGGGAPEIGGVVLSSQTSARDLGNKRNEAAANDSSQGSGPASGVADDDPNITPSQQMENILSDRIATIDNRTADLQKENAGLENAIDVFQAGIEDAQHQLDNPLDGHLERTATAIITQEAPNPYGRSVGLLGRIEVNRRSIQQARTQIATNNRLIADLSSRRAIAVGRREFFRGYFK